VEWIEPGGQKKMANIPPHSTLEIELPATWTNPVTAWPYWPDRNLIPGFFKPAGALFPFDVAGSRLYLNWEAGPDTVFYWELVAAYYLDSLGSEQNDTKIPANFDWQRFRELIKSEAVNEAVREDLWLINWNTLAERTIANNFDRRRLVPETAKIAELNVPAGLWHGTSPFAKPLFFAEGETPVFPVRSGINVWVSSEGVLRVNGETWVFTAWE
jgi:hypothetical protein